MEGKANGKESNKENSCKSKLIVEDDDMVVGKDDGENKRDALGAETGRITRILRDGVHREPGLKRFPFSSIGSPIFSIHVYDEYTTNTTLASETTNNDLCWIFLESKRKTCIRLMPSRKI
ncbi:hypothetical protein V1478_016556 [Vespula squamosa]|uniref:Uncharacterized protein n=1 Tax=Vespula squamosa TaxID=30214 RepID=A0ABD2A045_VESSQ